MCSEVYVSHGCDGSDEDAVLSTATNAYALMGGFTVRVYNFKQKR